MDKASFSDYVVSMPAADERLLAELAECHAAYPAASAVSFLYVRMLKQLRPEQYEQEKKKLLLSIANRPVLQQTLLTMPPAEELPTVETEPSTAATETSVAAEEEHELLDELIDKFGTNAPKIKTEPEKPEANVNYGKESCVENPELISETLALIFAQQGYYGKAIKIYKKLCLQNPEKSCYFAAQIDKLKEERNNNNKTE